MEGGEGDYRGCGGWRGMGVILYAVVSMPGRWELVDGRVLLGILPPPAPVPSARGLLLRFLAG